VLPGVAIARECLDAAVALRRFEEDPLVSPLLLRHQVGQVKAQGFGPDVRAERAVVALDGLASLRLDEAEGARGEGRVFSFPGEVQMAYEQLGAGGEREF